MSNAGLTAASQRGAGGVIPIGSCRSWERIPAIRWRFLSQIIPKLAIERGFGFLMRLLVFIVARRSPTSEWLRGCVVQEWATRERVLESPKYRRVAPGCAEVDCMSSHGVNSG